MVLSTASISILKVINVVLDISMGPLGRKRLFRTGLSESGMHNMIFHHNYLGEVGGEGKFGFYLYYNCGTTGDSCLSYWVMNSSYR